MSKARDLADFISDSTIETAELADNAVTSAKLDETDSYTVAGLTATTADINGGTIDGVTIGGASAGAGTFTGLTVGDGHTIGDDAFDNLEIASGSGENIVIDSSAGNILFQNNGSDTARINSNNKLLLGTTAEIAVNNNSSNFQIVGTGFDTGGMSITRFVNGNGSPNINFGKTRSGTIGTVGTVVNDNDGLGFIAFCGDDGTDIASRAASIFAEVDGTPGSNDMPGALVFSTTADGASSSSERMRITRDGYVGIGVDTPTANLHVRAANPSFELQATSADSGREITRLSNDTGTFQIQTRTSGSSFVSNDYKINRNGNGAAQHQWNIANSPKMTLDSSGRVLIGDSSTISSPDRQLQITGTTADNSSMSLARFTNSANSSQITFIKSRAGGNGSNTVVASGDDLGILRFYGDDGVDYENVGADIFVKVDGTPGSNDMPGRIQFHTASDGSASPTERMRIDNAGQSTFYPASSQGGYLRFTGQNSSALVNQFRSVSPNGNTTSGNNGVTKTFTLDGDFGMFFITGSDGTSGVYIADWKSSTITELRSNPRVDVNNSSPASTDFGLYKSSNSGTVSVKQGSAFVAFGAWKVTLLSH